MAGKISIEMSLALKMYLDGYRVADSARRYGVSPRGLRYAIKRKKEKIILDRRKR